MGKGGFGILHALDLGVAAPGSAQIPSFGGLKMDPSFLSLPGASFWGLGAETPKTEGNLVQKEGFF